MRVSGFRGLWIVGAALGLSVAALAFQDKPASPTPTPTPAPGGQLQPVTQNPPVEAPTGPPPKLVLSATEWNFGTKWFGEAAEGEIVLTNNGTGPLKIAKIQSSCGCTVAKPKAGGVWEGKVIEPGASEVVAMSYNTKKGAKKVTQTITIESNDPEQPRATIQVAGEVKNVFAMAPADRVSFGRLERDSQSQQVIEMTNNMEQPVKLTMKPFTHAAYDVQVTEVEAGKKYTLTVKTKPPLAQGSLAAEAVFETGLTQAPEIKVPISSFVVPRVSVTPPTIFLTPKLTQPVQRIVRVNYSAAKPLNIKEVKATSPLVKAELVPPRTTPAPTAPTRFHEIRVSLPGVADFPKEGAKLEILTDDADPAFQKLVVDIVVRESPARPNAPTSATLRRADNPGGPGKVIPVTPVAPTPPQPGQEHEDDDEKDGE